MKVLTKQPKTQSRYHKPLLLHRGIKRIEDSVVKEIKSKYSERIKREIKDLVQKEKPNEKDLETLSKFLMKDNFPSLNEIIRTISNEAIQNELWAINSHGGSKVIIFLSKNGNLYRDPKEIGRAHV